MNQDNCTFCNRKDIEEGILDESNLDFYHRANVRGAIAPGHSMIISREHYSCFGTMPSASDEGFKSYLDSVKTRFSEAFGDPLIVEQGIHGQSIYHAHLHFSPRTSEWYDFSNSKRFMDFVPEGVRVTEVGGIKEIRKVYDQEGEYILIGENDSLYLCHTEGFNGDLRPVREFTSRQAGLTHLLDWQKVPGSERSKKKKTSC